MTWWLRMVTGGLLFGTVTAAAESHPAWWRYASLEATALVGIRWEHVRSSPFAGAISAELSGDGGLGLPDLACIKEARQILISSPVLLAAASGNFPEAMVREQAAQKGLKPRVYREIEIWVTPGKDSLSMARISDQLVLLGRVKNLQDAIDRSLAEDAGRAYSPLLARAARYAQDDLWVVAAGLPDELAARFVPIDAEAEGFEGFVSLEEGLRLGAALNASSQEAAAQLAETLKQMVLSLPPVAQGIDVRVDQKSVTMAMAVSKEQLLAGLRATPPAEPQLPPIAAKPAGPQVIRIVGLDGGPREIVLR